MLGSPRELDTSIMDWYAAVLRQWLVCLDCCLLVENEGQTLRDGTDACRSLQRRTLALSRYSGRDFLQKPGRKARCRMFVRSGTRRREGVALMQLAPYGWRDMAGSTGLPALPATCACVGSARTLPFCSCQYTFTCKLNKHNVCSVNGRRLRLLVSPSIPL